MRDSKVVEGMQELINRCANKEKVPKGHHVVKKIGKHKAQIVCEMRLTAQIGDYEMDQAILDLGWTDDLFEESPE